MGTRILLTATLAVFVGVLGYAYLSQPNAVSYTYTLPPASAGQPSGYTRAQVAQHNSATSCWTAINGKVYDLTNWIDQHPGGSETILSICGIDGSATFNAQHGGQAQPAQELASFYIGNLTQ